MTGVGSGAERVVVVRNADSPTSCAIADDYAERRGVSHVVTVRCPDSAVIHPRAYEETVRARQILEDAGIGMSGLSLLPEFSLASETIDLTTYRRRIEAPLIDFLAAHPDIDVI